MSNRRWWLGACLALGIGFAEGTPGAESRAGRVETVTFQAPVALPGVTLTPGSYVFEAADRDAGDIVRVLAPASKEVAFVGFTLRVDRPPGWRGGQVLLGKPLPGGATPILVWYPLDETMGYRFLYRRTR